MAIDLTKFCTCCGKPRAFACAICAHQVAEVTCRCACPRGLTVPVEDELVAVTIRQPWASAIVRGGRRVERRTWRPAWWGDDCACTAPEIVARWVVVHAGIDWWERAQGFDRKLESLRDLWPRCPLDAADYPRGALIGVVEVLGACPAEHCKGDPWVDRDPSGYRDGWCWVLGQVVPLAKPVEARGSLGLWRLTEQQRQQVRAAWMPRVAA